MGAQLKSRLQAFSSTFARTFVAGECAPALEKTLGKDQAIKLARVLQQTSALG